ncbi:MAG: carboxypeptidase regulatory-like domain-containing protein [Planctomycetota bacterium]
MRCSALALFGVVQGLVSLSFAEDETARAPLTRMVEVVRGADGAPVAGAAVEAWGLPGGTVEKRTGADGIARFERTPRKGVVYVARKPGFRCGWHEPGRWWWSMPEEDEDPDKDGITRIRLALEAGTVVQGRVLAKDGAVPVAGAVVEAREAAHATDLWTLEGAPLWTATTDAEGRFKTTEHWPVAPRGKKDRKFVSAVLVARVAGWISERAEIWPADAGRQPALTFELLPAARVHGAVTGADGQPAAGALVHAYPPDFWAFAPGRRGDRDTENTHPRQMHVRADAGGIYSFPEAYPGVRYRVFAEATAADPKGPRNQVVARSRVSSTVGAAESGEAASCDLRLRRLGSLRVRVAQGAGGDADSLGIEFVPPHGARPWAYDHEQDDGSVVVREADPGRWTVEVGAFGWADQRSFVELGEAENKTVLIRLARGATVEGVVVDDDSAPVEGATLLAYAIDPEDPDHWLDGYEQTRSDENGRFRLTGLRAGPTAIAVNADVLRSDGYTRIVAPAKGVRIVLHAPGAVRFRLKPPDGAAAPSRVRVTVTRLAGAHRGSQWQKTVEASDGSFVIEGQMPGPVWFAVEARGYAPFMTRVEIRPDVVNEPEPFALSRGISLRGRVVDGAGSPVAGARVLAWGNEDNAVKTSRRGAFEIRHLGAGPVELSVTAPGMAMALLTSRVAADAEPLEIVLTPGGLVRGTILDPNGRGVTTSVDFFPAASPDDNVSRWRAEATDGAFSIRLPAGRYRCTPPRAGARRGSTVFDVSEGGEVVLKLEYR